MRTEDLLNAEDAIREEGTDRTESEIGTVESDCADSAGSTSDAGTAVRETVAGGAARAGDADHGGSATLHIAHKGSNAWHNSLGASTDTDSGLAGHKPLSALLNDVGEKI